MIPKHFLGGVFILNINIQKHKGVYIRQHGHSVHFSKISIHTVLIGVI